MLTDPEYQVAAYYFPQYHVDPRNERWHGPGWTEWELLKLARPRFEGHQQPKVPLWGYLDESQPDVAERKIDAAADHGVRSFIFDWYWYNDGPFLNRALEQGFLAAKNVERCKFALMWANHDWKDIHPHKRSAPVHTLLEGGVTRRAFDEMVDYVLEHYMAHPSYWRLDDALYFSIYELDTLVRGLGGIERTQAALQSFRIKAYLGGYGALHLNAVTWGLKRGAIQQNASEANTLADKLQLDSFTSYVWLHDAPLPEFPTVDYAEYLAEYKRNWNMAGALYRRPYFPNVTMGWDASPRTVQSDVYENLGYPFTPVLVGNTPEAFRKALEEAKTCLDRWKPKPKVITVNAWNEWTEGSYLEPDTVHGMAYLEAIRDAFPTQPPEDPAQYAEYPE
jgi:hypothetical protein